MIIGFQIGIIIGIIGISIIGIISRNDLGSGKRFPGRFPGINSRSTKFYAEKWKKCILSAIEIYKNRLKV